MTPLGTVQRHNSVAQSSYSYSDVQLVGFLSSTNLVPNRVPISRCCTDAQVLAKIPCIGHLQIKEKPQGHNAMKSHTETGEHS